MQSKKIPLFHELRVPALTHGFVVLSERSAAQHIDLSSCAPGAKRRESKDLRFRNASDHNRPGRPILSTFSVERVGKREPHQPKPLSTKHEASISSVATGTTAHRLSLRRCVPQKLSGFVSLLWPKSGLDERIGLLSRIETAKLQSMTLVFGTKVSSFKFVSLSLPRAKIMATPVPTVSNTEGTQPESSGGPYIVARQPILDARGRVHAFELLFRGGTELNGNGEPVPRAMAETAAFFALQKPSEMKKLTGKMTAFVSCPVETLSDQLAQTLPSNITVLEIPAGLEISPELIAVCQGLKAEGFRFALNNLEDSPQYKPLVDLADYVKVNFCRTQPEERRKLIEQLQGKTIATLARNVDTQMDHR
ncbi:MAG: hypothetical protein WBX18_20855, partial [Terracidiphilus sp.]